MHFLLEAVFIGVYCTILYFLLSFSGIKHIFLFLFLLGFIKRLLGYFLQLHTYYCNYGYACQQKHNEINCKTKYKRKENYTELFVECLGEGCLFLLLGLFIISPFGVKYIGNITFTPFCIFNAKRNRFISFISAPKGEILNDKWCNIEDEKKSKTKLLIFFFFGFFIHILFELLGFHKSFCENHCISE